MNDYVFKFTEAEANIIGEALGEMPAKKSINLILKLQKQANNQEEIINNIKGGAKNE